jgi:glutamate synthase (NADPH/NADH) large chain
MSGGIAYVLDEDGSFASRCNLAMVELEPMPDEEDINSRIFHHARDLEAHGMVDIMSDMGRFDAHRLHHLISRHAHFTRSVIAAKILAEWKTWYPKFRKVMPVEYRRALNELKAAAIAAE